MDKRFKSIIIPKWKINSAVKKAAKWVDNNYPANEDVVLIGLLKGCIPFYAKLMSYIKRDIETDFMVVSSYRGADRAQGLPNIVTDIKTDIKDKHIILVEDIIDSGYTVKYVMEFLKQRGYKSAKVVSLLNKTEKRKIQFEPDYYCFLVPDKFLVGFGLDYQEKFRNVPYIAELKRGDK